MYRSYTKCFRIFGAMIIFLQISKDSALFTILENTKKIPLFFFLSRTDSQAPLISDTDTEHGGAAITGRPKRADGESPARRIAPT